ncbi:hypothetical protein ACFYQ5_08380 [Streptomyces sp. NPDC005794]|uniref:hypothetical protein n=1 Tax=Streptomyces sp. NPDC005794 TaxID=3364733 RepID=UPI0036C5895B
MLETVPDHETADDRPYYARKTPRRRSSPNGRLTALRCGFLENVLSAIAKSRPIKVCTYVLATPGTDVDGTHARLGKYAAERGWRVHGEHFTDQLIGGSTQTDVQPEFDKACSLAGGGFLDGILSTGREAMPVGDDTYENCLRWLNDHYAFIAYPKPTSEGTPWTDR